MEKAEDILTRATNVETQSLLHELQQISDSAGAEYLSGKNIYQIISEQTELHPSIDYNIVVSFVNQGVRIAYSFRQS